MACRLLAGGHGDARPNGNRPDADSNRHVDANRRGGNSLHDGAIIIRDNRIVAASCLLPLSSNPEVDKRLAEINGKLASSTLCYGEEAKQMRDLGKNRAAQALEGEGASSITF